MQRRHGRPELTPEELEKRYDHQPLSKILPLIRPYRYLLIGSLVTLVCFNMIGLVLPWMLKIAIDRVIPNADYLLFIVLCFVMIIIYLCRGLLRYVAAYLTDYAGIRAIVDMRQKLFKHLQSLSLRFYEEYRTGKLISNVISDVSLLQVLMRCMTQFGEQFFQILVTASLLLFINFNMGVVVLLTMPLHYVNFYFFRKVMRKESLQMQERMSEVSANLSETLTGVKVVKSFAKERSENLHFFQTLRPIVDIQMRVTTDAVGLWAIFDVLTLCTYLAVIGMGIAYVKDGSITIGEFVAFYTYVGMLINPINILSNLSLTVAQGMVGGSRIVRLFNTIPEIQEAPHPIHVKSLKGNIEFRHVMFSYDKEKRITINDFSLTIRPGQKVALVGASGSGKSTISNLLLRFYDIDSGVIKVDGMDIRQLSLESYRNHVGVVLQEPFLFSGTILENISYARPEAPDEEVRKAAEMANVLEFVEQLPEGFETIIGENGASLSGGQKQRLAIARAMLKNPEILILDEATSALDTVSEFYVQEALDRLMEGKTTLIIAHRLSTIRNADLIVVMEEGRIVQTGKHEELIAQPGVYQELYQTQAKVAKAGEA